MSQCSFSQSLRAMPQIELPGTGGEDFGMATAAEQYADVCVFSIETGKHPLQGQNLFKPVIRAHTGMLPEASFLIGFQFNSCYIVSLFLFPPLSEEHCPVASQRTISSLPFTKTMTCRKYGPCNSSKLTLSLSRPLSPPARMS